MSWKQHGDEINRVIQKHSQLAGIDDEELQDAFTNIVRATGDVDKGMRGVGLAADIARAKNMDTAKAGELVGKVMAGNTGILARYGIVLKEGASDAGGRQRVAAEVLRAGGGVRQDHRRGRWTG